MELDELRKEIDNIDRELLTLFLRRMEICDGVAAYKQERGLPIRNKEREGHILAWAGESAGERGEYARRFFQTLMALSREAQAEKMKAPLYGLLGRRLGHSYSVPLHRALGCPDYRLFEREPEALPAFFAENTLGGLNVTIPYKQTVMAHCHALSDEARRIGCVNTVVQEADGRRVGYNTDAAGLRYLASRAGIDFSGRKTVIFGSGGAALTARAVAQAAGARMVTCISRSGPDNYENLSRHDNGEILINATPLGMYPAVDASPADPGLFPRCRGVLDLVYNPRRTRFLLAAEKLGIPCMGGLPMLAAQAAAAEGLFMRRAVREEEIEAALHALYEDTGNLVLIGMPGSGKSTVGRALAALTGRRLVDLDGEIEKEAGCSVAAIFQQKGEGAFRLLEKEAAARFGKEHGLILSTGGGVVLDGENYAALRMNGRIYEITRSVSRLARAGRPLSAGANLEEMARVRGPLYRRFRDVAADNNGAAQETAQWIWRDYCEHIGT